MGHDRCHERLRLRPSTAETPGSSVCGPGTPRKPGAVTLYLHRATSTDELADGLAELLSQPLEDPFAEEVVAVPARGVERWLAQRLSHRLGAADGRSDGVSAGIRFLSPHSLVALVLSIERDDPWHPAQLTWPVLDAIDASLDEPWARVIATHLGESRALDEVERELRRGRRFAVARRLAGLFASYASQRPAMLADWREGGSGDGLGGSVADDLAWQPELWRRVLERVDATPPDLRHAEVVEQLRAGSGGARDRGVDGRDRGTSQDGHAGLDLPGRLSLFGHTRIARSEVEVLAALATHRDVHLWLPQASPVAWSRLAADASVGPVPRDADDSAMLVEHPLLASLGRDARELQRTLALTGAADVAGSGGAPSSPEAARTLLGWLQHDLRNDHEPSPQEVAARVLDSGDRSLQIHACHGRGRQIDVVRDVLTGLLEADPSLEPRDVLVMCPDIDAYAPLVHAGFGLAAVSRELTGDGAGAAHPAHSLRVLLADRAPQQTNPLLALAARLVEMAGGRVTAGEVLDLARTPAVRRRFGLSDEDLDRLARWTDATSVRWGLDADHREHFDLHNIAQNTWRAALDRLLVGAALDGDAVNHVGDVLGLDDLDSGDIDLAGRLAELLERLGATLRRLGECSRATEWTAALRDGVLGLTDSARADAWQVTSLGRELAMIEAAASQGRTGSSRQEGRGTHAERTEQASHGKRAAYAAQGDQADHSRRAEQARQPGRVGQGGSTLLRLADITALLDDHRTGRPTRSNFRTGTMTVCTMVPMRSVPHRVIVLVGLDDGVFPRQSTPDGDDALARRPVTGERDARAEDRQLLLDAVMAAGTHLVITYTGADEHTGAARPPAVPLDELIDAARATACGEPVERLVTHHPLQPYDSRNLGGPSDDGEDALLSGGRPFSHDPVALAGGRALASERSEPAGLVPERLPARPSDEVDLADLLRFVKNPVGTFVRDRLGILLPEEPEERVDGIPLDLDGLTKWKIGDRILRGLLAGRDAESLRREELWRGELPPHKLGEPVLAQESAKAEALADATRAQLRLEPGAPVALDSLDVDLALPSGRRLVGTVAGVTYTFGPPSAVTVTYSTIRAKQRLDSWLRALALAASGTPGTSSHVMGQKSNYQRGRGYVKAPTRLFHHSIEAEEAAELLHQLVDLRDRGLREPLPLSPGTSETWAEAFAQGDVRKADERARKQWETDPFGGGLPGEQDTPAHVLAFGERAAYNDVVGVPHDDEQWARGVTHRLGQLALRLWTPVAMFEGQTRL